MSTHKKTAVPLERVRKRDGREVPFDRSKIRDAIAGAMDAVGDDDPIFADEVAGVVELALRDRMLQADGAYVPTIEEIQDFVERALMDLGRAAVAKAYILYRDRRARLRAALRVHDRVRGPLRVREAEGVAPWSKGRIVAALVNEAELPRSQAEEIAAAVERRVFASGWRRISTGLVRELVASELFERGWTQALRRHERIGLVGRDLRTLIERGSLAAWEERGPDRGSGATAIGGELLKRYALEELFSEELGELHRAGDLHVEDLRACDRPLALCIEAELIGVGSSAGTAHAPWRLLARVSELAGGLGRALVIEDPETIVATLVGSRSLVDWLEALRGVSRAAGVRVDLSAPSASPSMGHLVEALAEPLSASERRWAPRLYLSGTALEELCAREPDRSPALEALFAQGRLWSGWGEPEERFVGPGCHRRGGERGALVCVGAVALNLVRLARRAGAWREDLFQAGLAELVRASVEVSTAVADLQERSAAARALGVHARPSLAIVPVGLREALVVLGDGMLDPDQGARLLGLFAEAADRFGETNEVPLVLTPFFAAHAARRFAWLDARRAADEGGRQNWLFSEAQSDGSQALAADRVYSTGFELAGSAPASGEASGRCEAEALRTLRAGAFQPASSLGPAGAGPVDRSALRPPPARAGAEAEPHLAAWKRFELLRRNHAGEVELELFPPPRPDSTRSARELRPRVLRPLR